MCRSLRGKRSASRTATASYGVARIDDDLPIQIRCFAMTKQTQEVVRYRGNEFGCRCYPLEQLSGASACLSPLRNAFTGCRRGYVGHWAIEADQLFLIDARSVDFGTFDTSLLPWLRDTLPGLQGDPIPATWVSGEIALYAHRVWSPFDSHQDFACLRLMFDMGRLVGSIENREAGNEVQSVPGFHSVPSFLLGQSE